MMTAPVYIRKIRNARKRAYAEAYYDWLLAGQLGHPPASIGLSLMAAQAVRLNLNRMTR